MTVYFDELDVAKADIKPACLRGQNLAELERGGKGEFQKFKYAKHQVESEVQVEC